MKMRTMALATVAALALAGCGRTSDDTSTTNTPTADNVLTTDVDTPVANTVVGPDQAFANTAAASDAFEIATSQLALTASQNPKIKKFAEQMVAAHTESTNKLKAAASGLSPAIVPDPTLTAEQQGKLELLRSKTGKDFDEAYADAQEDAHEAALAALKSYAATGAVPAFKTFANELVPKVTAHLNMAKGLD